MKSAGKKLKPRAGKAYTVYLNTSLYEEFKKLAESLPFRCEPGKLLSYEMFNELRRTNRLPEERYPGEWYEYETLEKLLTPAALLAEAEREILSQKPQSTAEVAPKPRKRRGTA